MIAIDYVASYAGKEIKHKNLTVNLDASNRGVCLYTIYAELKRKALKFEDENTILTHIELHFIREII